MAYRAVVGCCGIDYTGIYDIKVCIRTVRQQWFGVHLPLLLAVHKKVDKMKRKKTRPKPKRASVESPYHPEVRILGRLDSKELRDLVKKLHKVRMPKALAKAINAYLDATKATETSYNRKQSQHEARRVAIRIRTKILEDNPSLDILKVPITNDNALLAILDWCADGQKIIDEQPKDTAGVGDDGEQLVRIEEAIKDLNISHSRVKQVAKDKEIYSKRSGTKKNSPYLVYKSEVRRKFGVHGSK